MGISSKMKSSSSTIIVQRVVITKLLILQSGQAPAAALTGQGHG